MEAALGMEIHQLLGNCDSVSDQLLAINRRYSPVTCAPCPITFLAILASDIGDVLSVHEGREPVEEGLAT